MVFQSTLPVSIGLLLTDWELDRYSVLAASLALCGGLIAIITLQIRRRFSARAIVLWAGLYAAFVTYVLLTVYDVRTQSSTANATSATRTRSALTSSSVTRFTNKLPPAAARSGGCSVITGSSRSLRST